MARPLPMPVVRVCSRSRTASRTFLASLTSPLAASTFTSSAIASALVLDSSGILMFAGLRISFKRMVGGSVGGPKSEAGNRTGAAGQRQEGLGLSDQSKFADFHPISRRVAEEEGFD